MTRWLSMTRVFLFVLPLLATPAAALAQATGQINGIVTDTSGAVLPGVTVEATNTATGAVRTAITGADGFYTIPLLQPGHYAVKASLSGFRAAVREGVRVTVTETARVTFELEVGQHLRDGDGHGRGARWSKRATPRSASSSTSRRWWTCR